MGQNNIIECTVMDIFLNWAGALQHLAAPMYKEVRPFSLRPGRSALNAREWVNLLPLLLLHLWLGLRRRCRLLLTIRITPSSVLQCYRCRSVILACQPGDAVH